MTVQCDLCGYRYDPWPDTDYAPCPGCGNQRPMRKAEPVDELAIRRAKKAARAPR